MNAQEVIDFWFKETSSELRFSKNSDLDKKIKDRFETTYNQVLKGETANWRITPEGRLAEVIVLDQFSRNMFRDSAKAFEADGLALNLSLEAIKLGQDKKLNPEYRSFLYMPLMHSEDSEIHKKAVELFSQPGLEDSLKYEMLHKKIIDRFGRYPHRNKVLGRKSTPEEIEFLKQGNSSF